MKGGVEQKRVLPRTSSNDEVIEMKLLFLPQIQAILPKTYSMDISMVKIPVLVVKMLP